jgi:hypothetical protein
LRLPAVAGAMSSPFVVGLLASLPPLFLATALMYSMLNAMGNPERLRT